MERPVVMESKQTRKRRLAAERQRRRRARLEAASNEETLHKYYMKMLV
jgi:heme exporter protein D